MSVPSLKTPKANVAFTPDLRGKRQYSSGSRFWRNLPPRMCVQYGSCMAIPQEYFTPVMIPGSNHWGLANEAIYQMHVSTPPQDLPQIWVHPPSPHQPDTLPAEDAWGPAPEVIYQSHTSNPLQTWVHPPSPHQPGTSPPEDSWGPAPQVIYQTYTSSPHQPDLSPPEKEWVAALVFDYEAAGPDEATFVNEFLRENEFEPTEEAWAEFRKVHERKGLENKDGMEVIADKDSMKDIADENWLKERDI